MMQRLNQVSRPKRCMMTSSRQDLDGGGEIDSDLLSSPRSPVNSVSPWRTIKVTRSLLDGKVHRGQVLL